MLQRGSARVYPYIAGNGMLDALWRVCPAPGSVGPVPVLYWLSGLTCTEENFIVKAGAQRVPPRGLAIVVPDTSPGDSASGRRRQHDFGLAPASTSATKRRGRAVTGLYSYITQELGATSRHVTRGPGSGGHLGHSMEAMERSLSRSRTRASTSRCRRSPRSHRHALPVGLKPSYLGADRTGGNTTQPR